jgi:Fe2+ transport system protein FeoA
MIEIEGETAGGVERRQETFPTGSALKALSELEIGKMAIVDGLELPDEVGHHLMHMGFVPEARVVVVRRAPAGDPTVYAIDGFEIALRRETARSIKVRVLEEGSVMKEGSGMKEDV